eukprot:scaffold176914_cov30-Tisochrysis_lutea.AAC.2
MAVNRASRRRATHDVAESSRRPAKGIGWSSRWKSASNVSTQQCIDSRRRSQCCTGVHHMASRGRRERHDRSSNRTRLDERTTGSVEWHAVSRTRRGERRVSRHGSKMHGRLTWLDGLPAHLQPKRATNSGGSQCSSSCRGSGADGAR